MKQHNIFQRHPTWTAIIIVFLGLFLWGLISNSYNIGTDSSINLQSEDERLKQVFRKTNVYNYWIDKNSDKEFNIDKVNNFVFGDFLYNQDYGVGDLINKICGKEIVPVDVYFYQEEGTVVIIDSWSYEIICDSIINEAQIDKSGDDLQLSDINNIDPPEIVTPTTTELKVTRIIDGDTIELENGERVRLICIDTPERGEAYFDEASDYLSDLILNEYVELVKDVSETDRYGRLLRYIYLNGDFVNEMIVEDGWAKAYRYNPDTALCDDIEDAETKAKNRGIGIWEDVEVINTEDNSAGSNSGCSGNIYNCGDFSSCSEVMAVFNSCSYDVNKLDRDNDGIPCESLCP